MMWHGLLCFALIVVIVVIEQAKMDDPSALKPDDWDEDLPRKIVDEV